MKNHNYFPNIFLHKYSKIKIIKSLSLFTVGAGIALISLFTVKARANTFVIEQDSYWEFWHKSARTCYEKYSTNLSGFVKAILATREDASSRLTFQLSSGMANNFHRSPEAAYADIYLDIKDKTNNYRLGFNQGSFEYNHEDANKMLLLPIQHSADYVLDGVYLQYNHAFSFRYTKDIPKVNGQLFVDYVPNLSFSLANKVNVESSVFGEVGATDIGFKFSDEYKSVGYGLRTAARMYVSGQRFYSGQDLYISPSVQYMGFDISAGYLYGASDRPRSDGFDYIDYRLTEFSLQYTIAKLSVSANYNYNDVHNKLNSGKILASYSTRAAVELGYLVDKHFTLKLALYRQTGSNIVDVNKGFALGFSVGI